MPGVGTFNGIDPKDSFSWGLTVGFFVTADSRGRRSCSTSRRASSRSRGTSTIDIGDETSATTTAILAYNFGESDAQVRPYVLGGLGATQYGTVTYTGIGGQSGEIGGDTQFSSTWAPA